MKIKIEFEGDYYEDKVEMRMIMCTQNMYCAINEAQELVRSRLKYGENISDIEEKTLENIREALYLRELED